MRGVRAALAAGYATWRIVVLVAKISLSSGIEKPGEATVSIAFLALFFAVQEPPSARVGQVHAELIGCRLVAREVRCELTVRNTGSADGEARIWSARAVTPTGRVAEAQAFTFGTARSRPYFGARQIMPSGVPMAVTIVFRSDTDPSGLAMLGVTVELAPDRRGELQFRDVPIER